jgi:hypothetical protein
MDVKAQRANRIDRIVMAGAMLTVLCTGFFGVQPEAEHSLSVTHEISYIQADCPDEPAAQFGRCADPQ